MKIFTGGGKTTKTLMELDKTLRWIYCAPFHKNIKENVTDSPYRTFDFLHLKSRSKLCTNPDAQLMFKMNYDIRGMCEKCVDKLSCVYEKNLAKAYKDRPNLAITHGHLQTWLPNFLNKEVAGEAVGEDYDVLIVDENPIKTFMCSEVVQRSDLFLIYSIAKQAKCTDDLCRFIELIMERTIDYGELSSLTLNRGKLIENIKKFGSKTFELWKLGSIRRIPKNIINHIYKINSYFDTKSVEKMVMGWKHTVKLSYFNPEIISKLHIKKIIALDGTATREVWEKMLGTTPDMMVAGVNYERAYQLKKWRYPISSWTGYKTAGGVNKTPERLCKLMTKIARRKKRNTLIVCTKKIQTIIESKMNVKRKKKDKVLGKNKIEFANYYALRGLNDYYKKCDTIILAHEPNPPQIEIETYTELSGWSEEIWRTVYREEEMQQAVGRIRENIKTLNGKLREMIEVFILPNTGVEEFESSLIPDAEVLTYTELDKYLDERFSYKKMRNSQKKIMECLPSSVSELIITTGLSRTKLNKYLNYLVVKGYIKKTSRIKYEITKKAEASIGRSKFWIEI